MPKFTKELPEKYYLDHFNEFIAFITQHCAHLLHTEQQHFLQCYQQLTHDSQCMFVRVTNRQGRFISKDKMLYEEIYDCSAQLAALEDVKLVRKLVSSDVATWLVQLTKPQLIEILERNQVSDIKKSATKQSLLDKVVETCTADECLASDLATQFLVKNFEPCLAYLLFLYFGNTSSKLDKFSMRDLGVLKTRSQGAQSNARFSHVAQAQCVFYFSTKLGQLKRNEFDLQSYALNDVHPTEHPNAMSDCAQSQQLRNEFLYLVGKQLLNENHSLALDYLQASTHSKAQEKWLRELYKLGEKDQVKSALEQLIEHSLDDALLLFAEDFYQRKFNQVKISKLTKKLREDSYELQIDQIHKDQVEKGVKQHYQQAGASAFRTENRLFNALFGLTFWQELFNNQADSTANEFDRRPKLVKDNNFYQKQEQAIERRLLMFAEPKKAIAYVTKIAAQYYGQPNGMFRWNPMMIQIISSFLNVVTAEVVVKHLRAMCKNYQGLNDGYPDLMIIENGQVRFEEVKAPGDAIRPNQFVSMNALQEAGFDVRICRVKWFVDPMQTYVVVDVETTGGRQPYHRITEIGAVKVVNGEVVDKWSSLINPQRHISKFITKLTGISNEMVKDAPLFSEIADSLSRFMQNSVFVAHNVNFDYGFFKQEFQRIERGFAMPKLCTVREMRKHFPGLKSYSLGNLCKTYDIKLENHHRALCDAEAAAVLLKMIHQQKTDALRVN